MWRRMTLVVATGWCVAGVEEDFVNDPLHDVEGEVAEKHKEENYDR